ncbi:aldo/keto reductase [Bombardia bombarda]|uniref:Aldo/keto reductase n=1 Tax=Bombardia bombarda TaxID=252184 RepID=A0AA39WH10_9PEZI|nr:aldo/keto reductase [Bombardia bombarda]
MLLRNRIRTGILALAASVAALSSLHHVRDIPPLGLGTWLSNRDEVAHAVEYALKSGYDHIDAAYIYRNEAQTGRGIAASRLPRSALWITSKLWNTHHRPAEATAAIQKSLADLGVARLDLYLMHWPVAFVPESESTKRNELDKSTSIIDTWRAMENLARSNLTRYIGISNFARHEVEAILDVCTICPYAHEFETHPYLQQQEFVDWHREKGIKVIAYSPLGNTNPTYDDREVGSLMSGGGDGKKLLEDPFWQKLAEEKGATVAQTVLAWGLQRGTVVIPKSTSEEHLDENQKAVEIEFSEEEMEEIAKRDKKTRMNNPGKGWGVELFSDLDDPTKLGDGVGVDAEKGLGDL